MKHSIFDGGFTAKSGAWIEPRPHIARFNGKRNATKSKILIFLTSKRGAYYTVRELADKTGASYFYIKSRLGYWVKWKYLERKIAITPNGKPCYMYGIATRGLNFVIARIPVETRNKHVIELKAWQAEHPAA